MPPAPVGTPWISFAEFVDFYQAIAFANCQGHLVEASLDVTWSLHDVRAHHDVARCHHALLAGIEQWLIARALPTFYVWVIEDGATFGVHSHVNFALPAALGGAFREWLISMLTGLVGRPLIDPGADQTFMLQVFDSITTYHQWRRFRYLMKSIDPHVDLDGHPTTSDGLSLVRSASIDYSFGGFLTNSARGRSPGACRPGTGAVERSITHARHDSIARASSALQRCISRLGPTRVPRGSSVKRGTIGIRYSKTSGHWLRSAASSRSKATRWPLADRGTQ